MTDKLVVLTTVDKEDLAQALAAELVERRLAACVNIFSLGASIYRWKGQVHRDREYMLLIKTSGHLFNEVRDTIRELHTYELPDVIALPVAAADESVLEWISSMVRPKET